MIRKMIAATGCEVSLLGLGTVKFGRNTGVRYPDAFEIPDDRTLVALLDTARDHGINLLDTAPAYGTSEERLGKFLQGDRENWVISTKVGEEFRGGTSHFDFDAEATRLSVERSLERLRTDYLDIVLIHSDGRDREIITEMDTLDTLLEFKRQGVIKAVGVSTKSVEGGLLALERCDLVMVTYNTQRLEAEPVLELARATDRGVLVKKALASGHLATGSGDALDHALRFVCRHPAVTSVILGTIDPAHLGTNAAIVSSV